MRKIVDALWLVISLAALLSACGEHNWNNPYEAADTGKNILYNVFSERPKHLDPVQSYSSNEIQFTAQIYEPPLQYHFLKRPFVLIPATAKEIPVVKYFDIEGNQLADDIPSADIAYSVYEISIEPGIFFQPHPAFAKNEQNDWSYHNLSDQEVASIFKLSDFPQTDTRELIAEDYLYQIKRLAHPRLHSPIYELMADYIVGLEDYANVLRQVDQEQPEVKSHLDLRNYPLEGAQVIDRYTYHIKLKGKYPQFIYWLAMPFFAPIPWEADRFYSQQGLIQKNITLDWYPVGTGPYMLTENNPNLRMTLEKNPNFHGEYYPVDGMPGDAENGLLIDAGKALPFVDKIIYTRENSAME
jgi:ABC-type transport system substrate-binding protein